ncbi:MAG TPA: cupin-like domain-containing protein [Candidatus Polarisedimenticolia bacterium]|jgi:lysine-specific demethylase 8|nr:cupin-like domain-containing protein [Candidatus Polarisedimenticolia bacterium]
MPQGSAVPRIHRPAPRAFFREFVSRRRPAILTGVAEVWPAIARWDPGHLKAILPDTEVRVEVWEREETRNDPADYLRSVRRRPMRLGDFLELVRAGGPESRSHYLAQYPLLRAVPRLRDDIREPDEYMAVPAYVPRALARRMRLEPSLWIGPAGAVTTLHFDSTHNLFVQIFGTKKVLLVPPEESDLVYYPCAAFGPNLHFSPVEAERPDPVRHPRFLRASLRELVVRPGEILFIPAAWWHYLRALEPSISLNFWWNTPGTLWGPPRHLLLEWGERIRRLVPALRH